MEDSPIRNLYYCKEGGMQNVEGTEKYNYLVEKANGYEKKIEEMLKDNAEVCKLYKEYKKIMLELETEDSLMHYEAGLKFGIRLGVEISKK